jgi:hypothetical protein
MARPSEKIILKKKFRKPVVEPAIVVLGSMGNSTKNVEARNDHMQ